MTVREQIETVLADPEHTADTRAAAVAALRASAGAQAYTDHPGRNEAGVVAVRTRAGEVSLGRVEYREWDDGNTSVEVWLGGQTTGPPVLRVFNPPTLVADPAGELVLADGKRYREDPLTALAEVVATHGGGKR